ncbi:hypothetical protein [Modestobacter lapidis]|nr:hypothetical protein [Modestobacter lapidis]
MTVAAVLVLAVVALAGAGLALRPERVRPSTGAAVLAAGLGVAAALAWRAGQPSDGLVAAGLVAAVLAATSGGGPVATAVLRAADPSGAGASGGPADPQVLRGGAWIGLLERIAIAVTLLRGFPEGLAVVLAVKGLGRYAELRAPTAAERFIIGTLASALWAAGCVGVAALLRS